MNINMNMDVHMNTEYVVDTLSSYNPPQNTRERAWGAGRLVKGEGQRQRSRQLVLLLSLSSRIAQ